MPRKSFHPEFNSFVWGAVGRGCCEGKGTESAALLLKAGSRPHTVANGHELFEVSEERDEEVAAFCHMLDM